LAITLDTRYVSDSWTKQGFSETLVM